MTSVVKARHVVWQTNQTNLQTNTTQQDKRWSLKFWIPRSIEFYRCFNTSSTTLCFACPAFAFFPNGKITAVSITSPVVIQQQSDTLKSLAHLCSVAISSKRNIWMFNMSKRQKQLKRTPNKKITNKWKKLQVFNVVFVLKGNIFVYVKVVRSVRILCLNVSMRENSSKQNPIPEFTSCRWLSKKLLLILFRSLLLKHLFCSFENKRSGTFSFRLINNSE